MYIAELQRPVTARLAEPHIHIGKNKTPMS